MAQIDPNIALGFKLPQIENPVNALGRAQEVSINALKMQELQRGLQEEEQLRNYLAGADLGKPETRAGLARFGKSGLAYGKALSEQEKAGLESKQLKNKISEQDYNDFKRRTADLAFNPSDENVLAHLQDGILRGQTSPGAAEQQWAQISKMNPEQRKQYFTQMAVDVGKRFEMENVSAAQQLSANVAMRGQDMARIPQGYRMTKEGTLEAIPGGPTTTNISPKEMQIREAKRPQATLALKTFEDKTSILEKDIIELMNHPGLPSITGIAAGRLPGLTAEGRAAEAIYDRIVKSGGFKELQEMRNASPTGGALGQVSNQENTSLQQTFAAINRTQEAKDVKKQLSKTLDELNASKKRVREAFDMTYDYRPSAPPAAADDKKANDPLGLR
jgi:hypothetical protein